MRSIHKVFGQLVIYFLLFKFHVLFMQVMSPESSFDALLNLVEMNYQLSCYSEVDECRKLNCIHHILSTPPHVFTTGINGLLIFRPFCRG